MAQCTRSLISTHLHQHLSSAIFFLRKHITPLWVWGNIILWFWFAFPWVELETGLAQPKNDQKKKNVCVGGCSQSTRLPGKDFLYHPCVKNQKKPNSVHRQQHPHLTKWMVVSGNPNPKVIKKKTNKYSLNATGICLLEKMVWEQW